MNDLLCLKWNNHTSTLLKKLKAIYSKDIFCDVTIACHGRYYPVHKLILSVCSEYFEEIFIQTQCKHPFLILKDIKPNELEALLSYMYNGEVNVPQEALPGLIRAAESLKIKGLAITDSSSEDEADKPKRKRRKLESSIIEEGHESEDIDTRLVDSRNGEKRKNSTEDISFEQDVNNKANNIKIEAVDAADMVVKETAENDNLTATLSSLESESLKTQEFSTTSIQVKEENILDSVTVAQCSSWDETWNRDSNLNTGQEEICEPNISIEQGGFILTPQEVLAAGNSTPKQTGGNTVYECSYCSFKSYSKTTWRDHCFEKHPGNDLFSCKVCRYQTNLKYLLNRHMYVHNGEKKYKCHLCSYKTAYSFNMKTHYHKHNISF